MLADKIESYRNKSYPFDVLGYLKGETNIYHSDWYQPRHDLRPRCSKNIHRLINETFIGKESPTLYCRGDLKHDDDEERLLEHPEVIYFGIEFHRETETTWKATKGTDIQYYIIYGENDKKYFWKDSKGNKLAESEDLWWGWKGLCAGIKQISNTFTEVCHDNHRTFPMANPTREPRLCPKVCLATDSKNVLIKSSTTEYFGKHAFFGTPSEIGKNEFGFYYKHKNWKKYTTLLPAAQCPNDAKFVVWLESNGKAVKSIPANHLCDVEKPFPNDISFPQTPYSTMKNACTSTHNIG